jgi:hypothetical protein
MSSMKLQKYLLGFLAFSAGLALPAAQAEEPSAPGR